MRHKRALFQAAAQEKVLRDASKLADAVRVTLGPKSKCVLTQKSWGTPLVCNDGVTIAKEFDLEEAEENLGAQMLRQAAERTGDAVGDETSTSAILAFRNFAEGLRNVAAGASAVDLKRALEEPTRQIAENSGADPGVVADRMRHGKGNEEFDASINEWVDLVEAGIIDATKVIRIGLENAVSVASVLLLTRATLTEVPEKKDPAERGIE